MDEVRNALTFDVEDWHQLVEWKLNGVLPSCSTRVIGQTHDILEVLARRGVRATFFVLGLVAEAYPQLVRDIADAGHEVGSHGWTHRLVYRQSPDEFAVETRRSKTVLEGIAGRPILGYRAAEFSITGASRWAFDILAASGFKYDSSVFPIAGQRYGIAGAPTAPHQVKTESGEIAELPMTVVGWRGRRFPVGGGGYFRLAPYSITRAAIRNVNREGRAAVVYFHPYEFSRSRLVPHLDSARSYLTGGRYLLFHNFNRGVNRRRFERLLTDFSFAPAAEILNLVQHAR